MKELTLTLTVDEINTILEALGSQPYIKVSALIHKINSEASQQLSTKEKGQ